MRATLRRSRHAEMARAGASLKRTRGPAQLKAVTATSRTTTGETGGSGRGATTGSGEVSGGVGLGCIPPTYHRPPIRHTGPANESSHAPHQSAHGSGSARSASRAPPASFRARGSGLPVPGYSLRSLTRDSSVRNESHYLSRAMTSTDSSQSPHRGFEPVPFRPAPWLPGPHLQTVGAKLLRPSPELVLHRERLRTPDDDFLDLDFMTGVTGLDQGPLVVILHGLEGSTARGYVRLAMAEMAARGLAAVGMNFRSCSGELNRRPRFYHSGETGDLGFVLQTLRDRWPGRPMGALGFSLGGNVLLKFLGEIGGVGGPATLPDTTPQSPGTPAQSPGTPARLAGEAYPAPGESPLMAAVAVSVPFDLMAGTGALESSPMGRLYTHYFLRSLRRKTRGKAQLIGDQVDLERVLRARTLRQYDEAATAPLHGFPGAEVYYHRSSSARFLEWIRTPTLLLQSDDDPFLPRDALPTGAVERNPHLLAAFTAGGGHVGFVEGPGPWRPTFWAEREAARYLQHTLSRLY